LSAILAFFSGTSVAEIIVLFLNETLDVPQAAKKTIAAKEKVIGVSFLII
jgi:hypothetical protein